MEIEGFGTPNYDRAGGRFVKNLKIVTGSNHFRIMPPMKSLAAVGQWKKFWAVHYGYEGEKASEPGKTIQRPFLCIEKKDFESKMIQVHCPACDKFHLREAEKKKMEIQYTNEGRSEEDIKALTVGLTKWMKAHNCDRHFHLNAMDKDGNFGKLSLSSRTLTALDAEFEKLRKRANPIDPLALEQGVWLDIYRTGDGFKVADTVTAVTETVEVPGLGSVERIKSAALTMDQAKAALARCADLGNAESLNFAKLSPEYIKMVIDCTGLPKEIDRIFSLAGIGPRTNSDQVTQPVTSVPVSTLTHTVVVAPVVVAPTPAAAPVVAGGDDDEAALQRQLADLRAAKAAKAAKVAEEAVAAANPVPVGDPIVPTKMTDEDFIAKYRV